MNRSLPQWLPVVALFAVAAVFPDEANAQAGARRCCQLQIGDPVILAVANPAGAPNLPVRSTGIVVCCDADDPTLPILVSWNNWTQGNVSPGHPDLQFCDSTPLSFPANSGWWVNRDHLFKANGSCALTVPPCIYDLDGDGIVGPGDLSIFACCWLKAAGDADCGGGTCRRIDFDCDGVVGPADLSWFATAWLKGCGDESILFPNGGCNN